jgi:serine/threonine-protein kinase HipA
LFTGSGLSLNISEKDNSLDLGLALSVAEYFRVDEQKGKAIIDQVKSSVNNWRSVAKDIGISKAEQSRMSKAFE